MPAAVGITYHIYVYSNKCHTHTHAIVTKCSAWDVHRWGECSTHQHQHVWMSCGVEYDPRLAAEFNELTNNIMFKAKVTQIKHYSWNTSGHRRPNVWPSVFVAICWANVWTSVFVAIRWGPSVFLLKFSSGYCYLQYFFKNRGQNCHLIG